MQVDGQACVVCPWHGSTFRLKDGEVVHIPASTDQRGTARAGRRRHAGGQTSLTRNRSHHGVL
ncbi:Rieske 2Fe-2S domain-containing protein [Micromonospora sp. NPDC005367]|uniref:Rieske 2Fe-2S domain-containing protein n=1 Tax=Micromonospora sp. NPDC005367 TaxID=3155590 RepID=UPI0033AF8057